MSTLSLRIKKLIAVVLTAALCLGIFAGCKSEEEVPTIADSALKDYIYKSEEFSPKDENFSSILSVCFDGSAINILASATEPSTDGDIMDNTYLVKTDLSGNVTEKTLLNSISTTKAIGPDDALVTYPGIATGKDGTVFILRRTAANLFAATPDIKMEIVSMNGGTETVLVNISEKIQAAGVDAASVYIYEYIVDSNNIAYILADMNSIWAFDLASGETVFENKPIPQSGDPKSFFKDNEGNVNIVTHGTRETIEVGNDSSMYWALASLEDKLTVTPIDIEKNDYGLPEFFYAPGGITNSNITMGDDKYDYYGYSKSNIFGYKDDVGTQVADLLASGVNLSEITNLITVSDTQFLLSGYKGGQIGMLKYFLLTKIAPEDVPDKTIITVASITEDNYLPEYIAEFSATHPEYLVEFKLYAKDSSTSFNDALKVFNMDVITGNVPDVLLIDQRIAYGNYVDKGLFADLYPLIDNDPDFSREDFLKPFLAALETDGKLYSIAPAFSVESLIGKTSVFGEKQGQSFAELKAATAKIPGSSLFGNSIDRDYFVEGTLKTMSRRFIDDDKGVCSFDSPEFISLLEYAKSLPEPSPDAAPYMNSTWMPNTTGDYKENRVLTELMRFIVFKDLVAVEKMDFDEPITFLGFPNTSGTSGIKALPRLETAIMESAKNPDGAWTFVKGLQTYSYPSIVRLGYPPLGLFPTLVSELEIAADNATIQPFEYDPYTGNRVPRGNWLGVNLTNLPYNTEADNAKMYALFVSIDGIRRSVPAIEDIIDEEVQTLFSGDKTPEETAAMIQNRATTYFEELK
ncbi:MAG: extracellular solute-binding protein [Ruminococcus sp.]|jgi:ABC-type glycerol-3-phosphate transport system substrate-binding protein|nr:extracellular solute-binding protein [Ruminococcus sp.]